MKIEIQILRLLRYLAHRSDGERRNMIIHYINRRTRNLHLRVIVVGPPFVSHTLNDYPSRTNTAVIRNRRFLKKFITFPKKSKTAFLVIENTENDMLFLANIIHELIAWLLVPFEIRLLYALNKLAEWRNYLPPKRIMASYEQTIFNELWKQR